MLERKEIDEYHEAIEGVVHAIKQQRRQIHDGMEYPDPTPMAPPLGYRKQPTLAERMREMIRKELSIQAAEQGHETFEEADDFQVGDDYDPSSPYEEVFDPPAGEPTVADHIADGIARGLQQAAQYPGETPEAGTPETDRGYAPGYPADYYHTPRGVNPPPTEGGWAGVEGGGRAAEPPARPLPARPGAPLTRSQSAPPTAPTAGAAARPAPRPTPPARPRSPQ